MSQPRHRGRPWPIAVLVLALIATTGATTVGDRTAPSGPDGGAASASLVDSRTVTLLTGDRVVLDRFADGSRAISVDAVERAGTTPGFHTVQDGDQVYVIPFDAAPLVPDVLDRELFNVTKLADQAYQDGVPVITTLSTAAAPGRARTRSGPDGLAVTAELASIHAVAATVTPDGSWWRRLRPQLAGEVAGPAAAAAAPDHGKVWLDERVEAALDVSVPLVGAPSAWDAGYDGTGVTVAVLDTGIDADHPDLAGKVVGEHNFTDSPDAGDRHGHGTHVAAIATGTGAASGGTYTGVAPGAELMNGKVLRDDGAGFESWVIAGMEWAAENGADVINMSLGAPPTDGTDPVSQALNQLTDEYGTLFVVAAGNRGNDDGTIDRPGAADAALTVGSVTKSEFLSFSSGRGPRLGDFAIKPDMTAPGVLITSARAEGSDIGTPVGDHYQRLSGTSMATPHVAGAAAILRQAYPDLTPAEVKAALVNTAVPRDIYDVYQQGGGRLDIPSALDTPVLATPASLSLGYFPYPQPDVQPVSAELTYTNRSDQDLTLDLALAVESRDGAVPSDAMLSVSPDTVTVGPGGSAQVTVTVDVTAGVHGLYGGYLVASSDGAVVTRTPVGFYHEPEHYDLTIEGVTRDGGPAGAPSEVDVINVVDRSVVRTNVAFVDGTATVRVPPGTYAVMGVVFSGPDGATRDWTMVGDPEIEVTAATTVTLDARDGNPVTVDTPVHPDAVPVDTWSLQYRRFAETGGSLIHRYTMPVSAFPDGAYAVPSGEVTLGRLEFASRSRYGAPGPQSPFLYDLVYLEPQEIPADLHHVAHPDDLAALTNRFHSDAADRTGGEIRHVWTPGLAISSAEIVPVPLPSERVEYLVPGVLRYQQSIYQDGEAELGRMFEPITEYPVAEQRDQDWWKGPRRPGFREGGPFDISVPATRRVDTMRFPLMDWVDTGPGHYGLGDDTDSSQFRLYRDGELVTDGRPPATGVVVDPEPATYRVEFDVSRDAPWWTTSVRTRTSWTFDSEQVPAGVNLVLPLILVDYDVDLDLRNTALPPAERQGPPAMEILARHQAGAEQTPIAGARLWISYDDGRTWRARPALRLGDGRYRFLLDQRHPGTTTGFVSLRVAAWDVDGNRSEQEIIRAWALPPR